MIFIGGFRSIGRRVGEGQFFCPQCGADRAYVRKLFRRWFTLFFIPVIPGKTLGEEVTCATCATSFDPQVLDQPTSGALTDAIRNAMRVAVVAMLRAGGVSQPAARAAVEAVRSAGVDGWDDTMLAADLEQVDTSQLPAYLAPLAQGLQEQGKESFASEVGRVGLADGPLTGAETTVLETVGATLGLSATHLRGIVASLAGEPTYPVDGPQ